MLSRLGRQMESHNDRFRTGIGLGSLAADGLFEAMEDHRTRWALTLDTAGVRALYASFSQFGRLEPEAREHLLDALARIAETEFGGRVERHMITALYIARRRAF
ncbi:MAG TPA: hypothetical protein VHB74_01190 [Devosia sp.]|nr:hypothetical protein [Devosia sp.]